MPIMNGLQATKLIRSFEETGNWDAAINAGIEHSLPDYECSAPSKKRVPIVAVSNQYCCTSYLRVRLPRRRTVNILTFKNM